MTPALQQEAARLTEHAMRQAPAEQLNNWIAAMHAATKHRSEDTAGLELIRGLYRSILSRYPANVAREACMRLTTGCEWFPTAKELTDQCDRLVQPIRALAEAVIAWREPGAEDAERNRAWGRAARAREDLEAMNRRMGFVGDISKLSPERRGLWEDICAKAREVAELEKAHRQMERAAA